MGYWVGAGRLELPDPAGYVRLRDDQLRAQRRPLRAARHQRARGGAVRRPPAAAGVAHPARRRGLPERGHDARRRPFRCYAVRDLRPPPRRTDDRRPRRADRGSRALDRRFRTTSALAHPRLRRGARADARPRGCRDGTRCSLTGWTDYAFSSDNVAAHQAGLALHAAVAAGRGRGRPLADGDRGDRHPGRPPADGGRRSGGTLARPARARVRIVTSMRVYWDQMRVATAAARRDARARLARAAARDLRERGFSAESRPTAASRSATTTRGSRASRPGRLSRAATRARATCASC